MIYIIDDKKERQTKYGWSQDLFKQNDEFITPYWTYEEMTDQDVRKKMISENNVILFHESFFNNSLNRGYNKDFTITRDKLHDIAKSIPSILIVFFSGSISSRVVSDNVVHMPVDRMYDNLEFFVQTCKEGDIDKRYLLYGKNPEIEEHIKRQYVQSINDFDNVGENKLEDSNFFLQQNSIDLNINLSENNITEKYIGDKINDKILIKKIDSWFNNTVYENLFIPLCFGSTFSDFNGLRLATMIRCTQSKNQLSRIFIYNFLNSNDYLEYLLQEDCFGIINTKNVKLIGFSVKEFLTHVAVESPNYELEELAIEMSKLKISIPDNYDDNHSIANEFGIYQLAYNAGIDIKKVSEFDSEKLESLYFKWLIAKNGLLEELPDSQKDENKSYRHKIRGLKLVGTKIDLSKF